MATTTLKIHPKDNVMVALTDLQAGIEIVSDNKFITLSDFVPAKHKFVIDNIEQGEEIIMYGVPVGKALTKIFSGGVIGTHNVVHDAMKYGSKTEHIKWIEIQEQNIQWLSSQRWSGWHWQLLGCPSDGFL